MKYLILSETKFNTNYVIFKIKIEDKNIKLHLNNLGFEEGQKIQILKSNYFRKTFLVKVMGINYAVDKKIIDNIIVYE